MKAGQIISYENIAAMLAREDDKVQAEFFNIFAKELLAVCGTHHANEMQLTYARNYLTKEAKSACATLGWEEEK